MKGNHDLALAINRRTFLSQGGVGLGWLALQSLIARDSVAAGSSAKTNEYLGLPGLPHFPPPSEARDLSLYGGRAIPLGDLRF